MLLTKWKIITIITKKEFFYECLEPQEPKVLAVTWESETAEDLAVKEGFKRSCHTYSFQSEHGQGERELH